MALKESKQTKISLPAEGIVPARLVRVIEIGEHPSTYKGKTKQKDTVYFYYGLPTRLIPDEGDFQGKPYMVRTQPLRNSDSDNAAIYDHRKVLGMEKDWKLLINRPAFLTITHNEVVKDGKTNTYANITNISGVPEGMDVPHLPQDFDMYVFEFDNPDPEVWEKLGDYMQETIQNASNYHGSEVEKMVAHLEAMSSDE